MRAWLSPLSPLAQLLDRFVYNLNFRVTNEDSPGRLFTKDLSRSGAPPGALHGSECELHGAGPRIVLIALAAPGPFVIPDGERPLIRDFSILPGEVRPGVARATHS